MQQDLLLNIIPFNPPAGKQTFAFYRQKQPGFYPVFKGYLQGFLNDKFSALELPELEKPYTDFQPPREGAILLDIDLSVSTRFASHYYLIGGTFHSLVVGCNVSAIVRAK